ncbi:MAG TPA: YncE family protein [Bryobacteraceae bacterium]|nr:YncE family protein [Bryobacteraceae bacterium]
MLKTLLSLALAGFALFAQSSYLILQKGASSLAYYSPDGRLLATVPTGQHPHEMVLSPDGKYLYTTDNGTMRIENAGIGGNSISMIDIAARRKVADISLGPYHRPHGIAIDSTGGRLFVTTEMPDALLAIDTLRRSVIRRYDTRGKTPHMVTLGPEAKWAYVSHAASSNVGAVDLQTGKVTLIPTGARPEGSVLSKNGKELYVCNRDAAAITVIDTTQQKAIANIRTGKGPVRIGITPDGMRLVYALMYEKKVGIADPGGRLQLGYALLPNSPVSLNISYDGKLALASAEEQDRVYLISIADKKLLTEIKTARGSGPDPVLALR